YLIIPRLNIPIPAYLEALTEQRFSSQYIDFPRKGILSFITQAKEKLTQDIGTDKDTYSTNRVGSQGSVNLDKGPVSKPVFWHGEEMDLEFKRKSYQNDLQIIKIAQEEGVSELGDYVRQRRLLLNKQYKLLTQMSKLTNRLTQLKERYLNITHEKFKLETSFFSNRVLLKNMETESKTVEQKIQSITRYMYALNEELKKTKRKIDEIESYVYVKLDQAKTQIQKLFWQDTELLKYVESPIGDKMEITKSALKHVPTNYSKRGVSILDLIIYSLIILILFYFSVSVFLFLFPYLKYKRKIILSLQDSNYNLSISLLYNLLVRILAIFGYTYPVNIAPEEYEFIINQKVPYIAYDWHLVTRLFVEARYSQHSLSKEQMDKTIICYRNILEELRRNGKFWQRAILRLWFIFNIEYR
ncbi:MAG: hypothetical protein NC908_04835, partial [Candidatus Omnitrophica bacterium]|nr:hypothetical protein [Candidatus Omnitrophota bacterium]